MGLKEYENAYCNELLEKMQMYDFIYNNCAKPNPDNIF